MLASGTSTSQTLQRTSPINTAIFLQLTSVSTRLTEMHYWLYSSIRDCLLHEDKNSEDILAGRDHSTVPLHGGGGGGEISSSANPGLLFSIAGVELAPSLRFRLQMLLHTGLHYLNRIQTSWGGLEAVAVDSSSGMPLQTHMLIMEDRRSRMADIHVVLDKLKASFPSWHQGIWVE